MLFIHQDWYRIAEAESCFNAMLRSRGESHLESPGLARYFELRLAWERKEYGKVGSEELMYLNQSRREYQGSRYELLYDEWKKGALDGSNRASETQEIQLSGQFLPYRINVDPRTFMAKSRALTGDKPAKDSFHPSFHPLCHQAARTMSRETDT